jgi:hypothetical protein
VREAIECITSSFDINESMDVAVDQLSRAPQLDHMLALLNRYLCMLHYGAEKTLERWRRLRLRPKDSARHVWKEEQEANP